MRRAPAEFSEALVRVALRTAAVAILGAMLLAALLYRRVRQVALAGALSLAVTLGSLASAATGFEPDAVARPRYAGLLIDFPALLGDARKASLSYEAFHTQLVQVLAAMTTLSDNVSVAPAYLPEPGTIRVLHVSDLHDSPAAWSVIRAVVNAFAVDVIVDTGDVTEWGNKTEAGLYLSSISTLGVPYLYVRGNQDSPDITAAAVVRNGNTVVLDNNLVTVAGLTFAGIGSGRQGPDHVAGDTATENTAARAAGERLAATVDAYNLNHDRAAVLVVHEPVAGQALVDSGPLVLAGHDHVRRVTALDEDTTLMVQAASGGRGILNRGGADAAFRPGSAVRDTTPRGIGERMPCQQGQLGLLKHQYVAAGRTPVR